MKVKFLIIFLLTVVILSSCTKEEFPTKFSFQPEKPKPGNELTIKYKPDDKDLQQAQNIDMIVYQYSKDLNETSIFKMERKGDGWIGKFNISDTALGLVIKFENDETVDNNSKIGYVINLYDNNGEELPGTNAGLASLYLKWGGAIDFEVDKKLLKLTLEKEFFKNPNIKFDFLESYFNSLPKSIADSIIQIELDSLAEKETLSQSELELLANWNGKLENFVASEKYKGLLLAQFPKSIIAQQNDFLRFRATQDINKKMDLLNEFYNKFPESNYLGSMLNNIVNDHLKDNNYSKALSLLEKFPNAVNSNMYNSIAWDMFEKKFDLEKAAEICQEGIKFANVKIENGTTKKPVYLNQKQWTGIQKRSLAYIKDTYANIQNELGEKEKALENFAEAVNLTNENEAEINQNYITALIDLAKYEEAKTHLEKFISSGKNTENMTSLLKDVYKNLGLSDSSANISLNKFEETTKAKLTEKIKKEIINKPAPLFTLTDLDGNPVNLSDYKGKTIILDFWATWCGPCLQSFPGMQKAVEKYADNPDIKFIFINTWENTEDKKKNAVDFITKNKYSFHVLLDENNEVIEKYEVRGIPTKFIIDKNQNIRFISVGFSGKESELIAELDAMISLLK